MNKRRMTRGLILLGSAVALAADPLWMAAQQQVTTTAPVAASTVAPLPVTQPAPVMKEMPLISGSVSSINKPKTTQPTTQISMRFKDAPIDAVLQHLSQAAGFEVVKDGALDGRVTVWADQPVSPEEAVRLLNTLLKPNGYTAIQMDKILKITSRDKAKKGSIPVHYGSDPDHIENSDELITQVIPVKSVDAVKLKADLIPLVGTDADLTANGGSNSIIMTDTSANIRRVAQIISQLDKRDAADNDIIVQQLKYADAAATAKLILDIFKPADATSGAQGVNPFAFFGRGGNRGGFGGGGGGGGFGGGGFGGGGGGGQGGNNSNGGSETGKTGTVTASSDSRTNTVVVTGPKDTLAIIKSEILTKIDANPSADQTFFTYHVKNGQAIDMQVTLNTLFGVTVSSSSNRSTSSTGSRTSSSSSRTGSSSSSGRSSSGFGSSSGSSGFGASSSSGFGNSSSNNRSGNNNQNSNQNRNTNNGGNSGSGSANGLTGAAADLIGQVEVVADSDTNSLLVLTATKYEDQVRKIILELDRPVPQVLIKVLIAEVTHDRSDDLGLDFSILNLSKGLTAGTNLGNIVAAQAAGGLAVNLVESQLTTTFHALAVAGKLDVLSRPYILTSDNQEANILVGQNVPFITDSRVTDTGQTINTIQYRDIGIILDVTPHINTDGLVVMDIAPEISSQSDQSIPIQPGVNAPVFNTRSASSHVGVKDGDTIVIGGLMQDQKTQTITKVPLLGDIPYLGLLFQRDNVTKTKTELLIFLTPHVAQAPTALQPMSVDEMKGVHMTPGAVQPGTFQDHINGLQLGGTTTQPALPVPKPEYDRDHWEPEPQMP